MAHLASNYDSFETFLDQADAFWTVDLGALNSSGVEGTAVLAMVTDDDGSAYLNVAISATGLTPSQTHAQHIHGLFDETGAPIDSVAPTIADDLDRDGMVEVLEGVGKYGDVILPPAISIAYRLIEAWFDEHDGPALSSLGLPDPPLRVPRPLDEKF